MILLLAKLCVFAKSKFFVPMLIQVCKSFRIRDTEGKSGLIQYLTTTFEAAHLMLLEFSVWFSH